MSLFISNLVKYIPRYPISIVWKKRHNFIYYHTNSFIGSLNEFKYFNINNDSYSELSASAMMSQHKENSFSHQIMETRSNFNVVHLSCIKAQLFSITENDDLNHLLPDPNLSFYSPNELFEVFKRASVDAALKSLRPISEDKYDNLSKALISKAADFDDEQLGLILLYLSIWPMSETSKSKNFNDLWMELDKACDARTRLWSTDKILYFIDLWYILKLIRLSDFVFHSINCVHKKMNSLTPQQVVQLLFYLNTIRSAHKGITMYNFEYKLEQNVKDLSLEEIGVAALGFFKTHTSLKSEDLLKYIINRTIDEVETVPEITLSSILKCLRLSMQIKVWRELPRLLDALLPHMERFSLQGLIHVALLASPSQVFHPLSLDFISQKLIDNIKSSRLKDMEKVLFLLSRLDYDPVTDKCVYSAVINELSLASRQKEIEAFPKSFIGLLHCLALRSIFPQDLIAKALDIDFIHKTYGSKRYHFGRELAFIDTCLELESKDYKGPRLPKDTRSYLYSRYSHYAPNVNYKMSKHAALAYDVLLTAQSLFGKESAKFLYVVPSHPRPDIVVKADGLSEELMTKSDYEGPVHAPKETLTTTCLVVISKNMLCSNENMKFNGETVSKLRSISTLGYQTKMVFYNEWPSNESLEKKEEWLEKLISSSHK